MSWLKGNPHHMGVPPGVATSAISNSQLAYNPSEQKAHQNWNSVVYPTPQDQTIANTSTTTTTKSDWYSNQTRPPVNYPSVTHYNTAVPQQQSQNQYYHHTPDTINNNNLNINNHSNVIANSKNNNHNPAMTSQYFDNTKSSGDGWGDEWGDFNDDGNVIQSNQMSTVQHQHINSQPPPPLPMQQPQQHSLPTQQQPSYQSSAGYMPPNQFPPQNNVNMYNYNQNAPQMMVQQPAMPPPLQNEMQPPQQQQPAQQQLPVQHQSQPFNPYSKSFQQPAPDNWNWNTTPVQTNDLNKLEKISEQAQNVFSKVSPGAARKHIRNISNESNSLVTDNLAIHNNEHIPVQLQSRLPDEHKNTQNITMPQLTRVMRNEHYLTPQWSIESQASQTSSDRSIESDNLDTRSSATNTSDEPAVSTGGYVPEMVENNQILNFNNLNKSDNELDSLDQALMNMNIVMKEKAHTMNFYQDEVVQKAMNLQNHALENNQYNPPPPPQTNPISNLESNFSNLESLPQAIRTITPNTVPPTSFPTPQQYQYPPPSTTPNPIPQSISPNLSQSSQMNLPPPKMNTPPLNYSGAPPPQQQHAPMPIPSSLAPPLLATGAVGGNPFKRTGSATHRNLQYQPPTIKPPSVMPTNFYSEPSSNQENPVPENSEIPEIRNLEVENLEIAPSNERNQYLQTGHLSEEGHTGDGSEFAPPPPENNDNLPPPGLSRLVLGQPESENRQINQIEPPPGLDRMILGTELNNSSEVNLARQADGQAANTLIQPIRPISNRNLYQVAGDSGIQVQQRVVPGVEHDTRRPLPPIVNQIEHDVPINEQQRELIMDGENVDDQPVQQQQQQQHHQPPEITTREEPIEGANTLDEIPQANLNQAETESNLTFDGGRKDLSNPSTANDDSDKDRHIYYSNKSKRSDDPARKRGNKTKDRYETEDTDYYSDRDRRRFDREGSVRDGRVERPHERDRFRDSKERDVRDKDRNRERREGTGRDRDDNRDRYERDRYRDRYDRSARYETDGSKYDNESSSRYDRDNRRKYDHDDYEHKERRYRRHERDERKRDDRYREDREGERRREPRGGERRGYEYDDAYNRSGSRNTSERDLEKLGRYPNYYSGVAAAGYGYNPYQYYQQQQQYYENMRRTNPQAYAEWYRKYYAQMQSQVPAELINRDGRESVHSGRSSANGKERYNQATIQQQFYHPAGSQTQMQNSSYLEQSFLSGIGQHPSGTYIQPTSARSYYTHSEFSESRADNVDATGKVKGQLSTDAARLTPCKFINDHSLVSLASGIMVCLKPNRFSQDLSNVIKILNININDGTRRLFNSFPGPLARGVTHKKTVIEFCEEQIRNEPHSNLVKSRGNSVSSLHSPAQINKPSYVLMWKLLILLLRQNGMVVGTDISELLLKNQIEFPYEITSAGGRSQRDISQQSGRNSVQSNLSREHQTPPSNEENNFEDLNEVTKSNEDILGAVESKPLTEDEVTEKFRSYLLYGNVNEALDWATDNNLWGHALFLASKVDRRSHANVLMKFANKIPINDPLQTLYQLMSGRVPSAVTSVQDEKWGDWRSHLAMILANTSQKPDLDRKAITTLGDSLYNRGDLFGAQFCYLMAQVGFGKYTNVNQESALMFNSTATVRLILLGSSHHKSFKEFATNEAIIMTEIYEYACTLNDDKFSIIEFQPYKYLLATRMLDYGFQLKTLMYMEQISSHIQKDVGKYSGEFIEKIFVMADRLKYFDPALEKTMEDNSTEDANGNMIEDQKWLQTLRTLAASNMPIISSVQTAPHDQNQIQPSQPQYSTDGYVPQPQPAIDNQYTDINNEFNKINKQFSDLTQQYQQPPLQQQIDENQLHSQEQQPSQSIPTYNPTDLQHQYGVTSPPYTGYDQQQNIAQHDPYGQQIQQDTPQWNYDPQYGVQQSGGENIAQQAASYDWNEQKEPSMQIRHRNIATALKSSPNNDTKITSNDGSIKDSHPPPPASFSPIKYSYEFKPKLDENMPKPTISIPNSMSNKPGFYDESPTTASTESPFGQNNSNNNSNKNDESGKSNNKKTGKDKNDNHSDGWFGGLWKKVTLKPKNQMILPDDKNPAIVWDAEEKKWINTDGVEEPQEAFKPPPKLSDMNPPLMAQQMLQQQTQHHPQMPPQASSPPIPQTGGLYNQDMSNNNLTSNNPITNSSNSNNIPANLIDSGKVPNLQSNMFKMQRNRTLKNSYVDVFNPSGAPSKPIENVLPPPGATQLPPVPQGGFFIPGAPAQQSVDQQKDDGTPQFYNPNQYSGYQQ